MLAPVITLAVAAPLNVLLNYLLVWGPESIRLGFIGAPIATAISMTTMAITSVAYAWFTAPRDAWGGLSMEIFSDLSLNIKLGLAGTAMVASEWWCWEIVYVPISSKCPEFHRANRILVHSGLASSFLGPTALAAQSVLLTSASLTYQVPYSLAVAAAVRAGSKLTRRLARTLLLTGFRSQTSSVLSARRLPALPRAQPLLSLSVSPDSTASCSSSSATSALSPPLSVRALLTDLALTTGGEVSSRPRRMSLLS